MRTPNRQHVLTVALLLASIGGFLISIVGAAPPAPDLADYRYGPHERNVLDLWRAGSKEPTALLAFFHGGGFDHGDKNKISGELVKSMLSAGISVMAVNYRLTPQARYPEHYHDCARAIQTARLNCRSWNIDPDRIAATGTSAGGVISLWLAFHDDLADAGNSDPVLRQSTRLKCAALLNTPTSLDPRDIRNWLGEPALKHRFFRGAFFGVTLKEARSPAGLKLFVEASPLTYLTADDPPVFTFYFGPKEVTPDISVDDAVHHYNFGVRLKERMDALNVECTLVHISEVTNGESGLGTFLEEQFAADAD